MLADTLQAGLTVGRGFHRKAFHLQQSLQRLANLGLIIDDEHRACQAGRSAHLPRRCCRRDNYCRIQTWTAFLLRGKSRVKVVPAPGLLSTRILPACS